MTLPKNTEAVSVSMPSWLIELVDDYAGKHDFTRSSLITRAIRKYLSLKIMDSPELWERVYHNGKEGHESK